MEKVRVMSIVLRVVAVALVAAISCVCVKADDSAGSGVTISGTVLTEPGGKPVKKGKVLVLIPQQDFAGETTIAKDGTFYIGINGYNPGTVLIFKGVDKKRNSCGYIKLDGDERKNVANDVIIGQLAESSREKECLRSNTANGLKDAITSITGLYYDPIGLYRDHKTVMILVDGNRWMSKRNKRVNKHFGRMYNGMFTWNLDRSGNVLSNDKKHPMMNDLCSDIPFDDVVRIDYLTSTQALAVCNFIAPGGVLLITTKADPEMKWVDDLRLTMVEL